MRAVPGHGPAYLSRERAQWLTAYAMRNAGIPARSVTARCMFERAGACHFGRAPLWDTVLKKNHRGDVLAAEFFELLQNVVASGMRRQRAARRGMLHWS